MTHNKEVTQMKKRSLTKVMAMLMACAMLIGNTGMVAHATDDGCYHGNGRENGGNSNDGSASIGGSGSSDSGSSNSAPSDSGSSSNSDSGSDYYDDGAYHGNGRENGGDSGGADIGSSDGGSTYTAPSGLATKGNTVTIPGCETFRQVNKPTDGRVAIYHCGIEQYTAQLSDAKGNAVAYASAGAYKDEATGKWYLNITTADGVDTTGYTVGTWKGSITYLPKLGMSGVMLNEVVVVNAEEAATK